MTILKANENAFRQVLIMGSFSETESRELPLKSKTNFSGCLGIIRLCVFFLLLTGCQVTSTLIEPEFCYIPQQRQIECLPSAFDPLSPSEKKQDWGKELLIANAFIKEFDLYRAITSFKRALVLLPQEKVARRLQIQYNLIQAYYLGQKYQDAVETFEKSDLIILPVQFPATGDLLIILYDSYLQTEQEEKAEKVHLLIEKFNPQAAESLDLSNAFQTGNWEEILCLKTSSPFEQEIDDLLDYYQNNNRSVRKAQFFNALLPGAGYYYVEQKNTALTAFIINTLFIAAAYQFFERGDIAAGIIASSFEAGWYFGGIHGAALAAKEWNQNLYQNTTRELMVKHRLFPSLMLETAF